jgi:predicted nucleic acid-binding protein
MAQVAAIYTVGRHVREPEDVLADLSGAGAEGTRPQRPKVTNKRVWASVEHEPETVIEEAFREARARDPKHRRQWVVLVDGNKDQLAIIETQRKKLAAVRIVVDLIHVLEYLWRAARALFGDTTKAAEAWVQEQLLSLLRDRPASEIAAEMRSAARRAARNCSAVRSKQSATPLTTSRPTLTTCTMARPSRWGCLSQPGSSKGPVATW